MTLTEGTLLGGRVFYAQPPAPAFRSGLEPVLLAACVPARAGEVALELGCGSGAGLLCLAHRTRAAVVGADIDAAACAVARANLARNGFAGLVVRADVAALPVAGVDHAFANPPYHGPGTASPHAARELAKRGGPEVVSAWARALLGAVRRGGTATIVVPAGSLAAVLAGFGGGDVLPVWPRAGQAARFVIVQAVRGRATPARLLPGLTLHQSGGWFTPEAEGVLSGDSAAQLFTDAALTKL